MDLVAGAMGNLAPKLLQLLHDEYKLQKGVKAQVNSLARDLKSMHLALREVAMVPEDQLNPHVKLWASDAREASYDIEDILDTFLVRVHGCLEPNEEDSWNIHRVIKDMRKKFSLRKLNDRHNIAGAIEDIKKQVDEMTKRRDSYKIQDIEASSATSIDPRALMALRTKASDLVGIHEPKDALVKMLTMGDDKEMKIVSIVGSGGLGKTTLARVVYEQLTVDMKISCKAFVSVGRNPDLKKVFREILHDLDKPKYMNNTKYFMTLDDIQLIKEIRAFITEKRYFIVVDDVWEVKSWQSVRAALEDNNLGSKVMMTTRISAVAEHVPCTYKIKPLPPESARKLFYGRIFGYPDMCPELFFELSDKILKKCDGVPLAIITIASLLSKSSEDITKWQEVCNSIGSGLSRSNDMYHDMRKILSLSYYDLPPHMKACFLYLSMYPEDYLIMRDQLIWRWISEGFIQPQRKGEDLFELGVSYFNDLINRSLVQPMEMNDKIHGCRVHDMILDLVCSLSREENFVTTSDDMEQVLSSERKKIRRLSLKNTMWPETGVSQVRSIAVFGPSIGWISSFSCFDKLRVLDIDEYSSKDSGSPSKLYVGNMIHLRYLRLIGKAGVDSLPRGIEKLQFLQVLLVQSRDELPESAFGLKQLMCLKYARCCPRSGNLLRNFASLQVLNHLVVDKDPSGTVEALGHLTQLTDLSVSWMSDHMEAEKSICDAFIDSLGNLSRLQRLCFNDCIKSITWDRWAPPSYLCEVTGIFSQRLPKWISPNWLPNLTALRMYVFSVGAEDIKLLGTLRNLVDLQLSADQRNYWEQPLHKFVTSPDAFPRLRSCVFHNVLTVPSMFTTGAMPRVWVIIFSIRAGDFFCDPGAGLDFHDLVLHHLPSLERVMWEIYCEIGIIREEEVEKLKEAVKDAVQAHPNHPAVEIIGT